jgi:hypothetical protein
MKFTSYFVIAALFGLISCYEDDSTANALATTEDGYALVEVDKKKKKLKRKETAAQKAARRAAKLKRRAARAARRAARKAKKLAKAKKAAKAAKKAAAKKAEAKRLSKAKKVNKLKLPKPVPAPPRKPSESDKKKALKKAVANLAKAADIRKAKKAAKKAEEKKVKAQVKAELKDLQAREFDRIMRLKKASVQGREPNPKDLKSLITDEHPKIYPPKPVPLTLEEEEYAEKQREFNRKAAAQAEADSARRAQDREDAIFRLRQAALPVEHKETPAEAWTRNLPTGYLNA